MVGANWYYMPKLTRPGYREMSFLMNNEICASVVVMYNEFAKDKNDEKYL